MKYKFYVHDTGVSKHLLISTEPEVSQLCELLMFMPDFALDWYIENIDKVLNHEVNSADIGSDLAFGTVYYDVTHIESAFPEYEPDVGVIDTVLLRKIIVEFREEYIKMKKLNENRLDSSRHEDKPKSKTTIIEITDAPDDFGVYEAKIFVDGVPEKAISTFFPKHYDSRQMVETINEAYNTRQFLKNDIYIGRALNGMKLIIRLDEGGKIVSAFPIYNQ